MVITKGKHDLRIDGVVLPAGIKVYGPRSAIFEDLDAVWEIEPGVSSFIYSLDFKIGPNGKALPNTRSTLEMEVPNLSKELWTVKGGNHFEVFKAVVTRLRVLRSPVGENVKGYKIYEPSALIAFLAQPKYSSLRLWNAQGNAYQFQHRQLKEPIAKEVIDDFMDFSHDQFGSYTSKNIRREYRKRYSELGFVEIGYVGQEESG